MRDALLASLTWSFIVAPDESNTREHVSVDGLMYRSMVSLLC